MKSWSEMSGWAPANPIWRAELQRTPRMTRTLAALAKEAPFPQIRLMQGGPKPKWTRAEPQTVAQFSALHFAFGARLQRELKVPVGLIVGAVGGTPSGSWIPPATYANSEKCKAAVAQFAKIYDREAVQKTVRPQTGRLGETSGGCQSERR